MQPDPVTTDELKPAPQIPRGTIGWYCPSPCNVMNSDLKERLSHCRVCNTSRNLSRLFVVEQVSEHPEEVLRSLLRRTTGVLRDVQVGTQGVQHVLDALAGILGPEMDVPKVPAVDAPDHELALQAFRLLLEYEWSGEGGFCLECGNLDTPTGRSHRATCAWGELCDLLRKRGLS